jgi:flavodoxin
MKNIVLSIFDEKFMHHAIRMYKSYRFFDKKTNLYAGSLGLSEKSIRKLNSIGVNVLKSKKNIIPKNLCICDLLAKDYIENLDYDNVMWIDADTIILRPVDFLFKKEFEFIGHGGNIKIGDFKQNCYNCYPYKSTWIRREIKDNFLHESCKWGDFFAMGLWVAKNKKIIDDFYELYEKNQQASFEGDICSELINSKYRSKQLNGLEWSLGTLQNDLIFFENGKITLHFLEKKYYPFQFGYSRINNERPVCEAIEKFYKYNLIKML